MALRSVSFKFAIDCPRCGLPIYCEVPVGPGLSVGTSADGTAEATLHIGEPFSHPHTCKTNDQATVHNPDANPSGTNGADVGEAPDAS